MPHERILLVNPPIYDFAAYDYWLKPLGLLYLSSILKNNGKNVFLLDAMDRHHPYFKKTIEREYGTGKFEYKYVEKPHVLKRVPRRFKRYGLPEEVIKKTIEGIKPDIVLVTTTLTYWYPGAVEILNTVKEIDKSIPVILGGIYPTLIKSHAKTLGFDRVFTIREMEDFAEFMGIKFPASFRDYPIPDYSFYRSGYVSITTSVGCPFRCPYCASYILYPEFSSKEPEVVVDEILFFAGKGIRDIAFYDDALLFPPDRFISIFSKFFKKGIRFHTPNGVHARFINREIAEVMKGAGFVNPRVSLETTSSEIQMETGGKVFTEEFVRAVENLRSAGYGDFEIGGYILFGLPGQTEEDCRKDMEFLNTLKVRIYLSEFSPVPGTGYYNLSDPIMSNNSAYLYITGRGEELERLKGLKNRLNP